MTSSKKTNEYLPFLTDAQIEDQAQTDIIKYQKLIGKQITFPVFPDEIIEKLWRVSIEYHDNVVSPQGESVLACFVPHEKKVYFNNSIRGSEGRVSFSLAHEAGHVSLHNFMSELGMKGALCRGSTLTVEEGAIMLERQADKYASALLMPRLVLMERLKSLGYGLKGKFDLLAHGKFLKDYFGVSYQALEKRLSDIGITAIGGFYKNKPKKVSEKFFEEQEIEREGWSMSKKSRM